MEIFVKVITENLVTEERGVCNTAFLTFVAIDENGRPTPVPPVYPETEYEKPCMKLHQNVQNNAGNGEEILNPLHKKLAQIIFGINKSIRLCYSY